MERNLRSAFLVSCHAQMLRVRIRKEKILGCFCRSVPGSAPESFVCLLAPRYLNSGGVATAPMCMYKYTYKYSTCKYTGVFLWFVIEETWQRFLLQYSCVVKPVLLHECLCCSKSAWQGGLAPGPSPEGVIAELGCWPSPSHRALRCRAPSPASRRYSGSSSGYATHLLF